MQGDEKLVALVRADNAAAFDAIVDRYQSRLLGFCRQMLGSTEDAEDVLQEVFVNAYRAMRGDNREINLRPWLYRIARNRCLNHLRKPTAEAQESMDGVPVVEAASTHERVHNREEFRRIVADVNELPDTQRAALLLREMDALSYEEIAQAMDTTVPSVKSLLVRARISLAEESQARRLTCSEVRLELAESAEGLRKASGPARRHVRDCEQCADFRSQIRADSKALAALSPIGPLLALKAVIASKLGLGGGGGGAGAAGSGGTAAAGAGTAGGAGTIGAGAGTIGAGTAGSAAGGLGVVGSAIGAKAVAGVVTAAVLTAGAVEVKRHVSSEAISPPVSLAPRIVAAKPQPLPVPAPPSRPTPPEKSTPSPASDPVASAPAPVAPGPTAPAPASTAAPSGPAAPATETETETGDEPASGGGATIVTPPPHSTGATAVTTVGDPQSKPSSPPPGYSDPPSSTPSNGPSTDPPTEGVPVTDGVSVLPPPSS